MCLIEDNLKLVHYVCQKFDGEYDDLYQIGCIGLIKAAKSYNEDRGKFSTWAVPIIRNEILMSFRRKRVQTVSLDEPINEDGNGNVMTLSDTLSSGVDIEGDVIDMVDLQDKVNTLMSRLTPKYQTVLRLHIYGMKQDDIAKAVGYSRQHINKLLADIRKLGATINKDYQIVPKSCVKRLGKA